MEAFFRDLKHSLRMFRQTPSFTIAAVAALALGIGANTAIFSVVNAVLLKPVPFPDPDRFLMFMNTSPQGSGHRCRRECASAPWDGRVETACGKFENGFDLLARHGELLHHLVDRHPVLHVLEDDRDRRARALEYPGAANLARDTFNSAASGSIESHG